MQIVALAAAAAAATAVQPVERMVEPQGILRTTIDGVAAALRIDPAAPEMPLIDVSLAERAKLKMTGRWGIGIGYRIGSALVMTRTQVVRVDLGRGPVKRRVGWTTRAFARAADGSIGPAGLMDPVVRFRLHDARPGERTVSFRAVSDSAMFGLFSFGATFAEIDVGGEPMRLRFDPYHARSLATAGAAVRLARAYDGVVSGAPVPTEIFFGVERPVRTLTLRRSFAIGPVPISELGVRLGDSDSTASIREAGAPPPTVDPDEVIVTAKGRKRDPRRDVVSLGADYLARCSSIVFDKPAKQIRLTCL